MTSQFNIKDYYLREKTKEKEEIDPFTLSVKGKKITFENREFKLDYNLLKHLDILINDLEVNDDALIIIVGPEGAGKTYFASQLAYYCSIKLKKKFDISRIHFDGETYIDSSLNSENMSINFLDESRRAINKMRSNSKSNVEFMNFLSECRSQNQLHFLLLPSYTDLDRYVAVHRPKLLLSVEKTRGKDGKLRRGIFNIWKSNNKSLLNQVWENKYKNFPYSMRVHSGRFENILCVNKNDYDNKKEEAKKERYLSENNKEEGNGAVVKTIETIPLKNQLTEDQQKILNGLKQGLKPKAIQDKYNYTRSQYLNNRHMLIKKGYLKANPIPEHLKKHMKLPKSL